MVTDALRRHSCPKLIRGSYTWKLLPRRGTDYCSDDVRAVGREKKETNPSDIMENLLLEHRNEVIERTTKSSV